MSPSKTDETTTTADAHAAAAQVDTVASSVEALGGPYPGVTAEQAENHAAALVREGQGYDAKVKACEAAGDKEGAALYKGRADQVAEQLKKLGDSATTTTARSAKR